ncbi:Hint domain-containing protein [Thioclava sp.]|uniref:Hint domain-containing protein n=1 Tax=Thioclava sp. TaxID=1933450 RepID=UPI003AA96D29
MAIVYAWQFSDLRISGTDPFASDTSATKAAVDNASFTLSPKAATQKILIRDEDLSFEGDDETYQYLAQDTAFDEMEWNVESPITTPYSYIVRPSGSDDPADNITIFVVSLKGEVHGLAASAPLLAGQSYDIVDIENCAPSVSYSNMAVCFARGTRIATKQGPVAVEDLRPGMRVQTADNGYRALIWTGRWRVHGRAQNAPIRIAQGALGNDRALEVSAQHRIVLRPRQGGLRGHELLLPAKALLDLPGITRAPRPRVEWLHLLFERHEIVFAEGARAESLLPGPQAMRGIDPSQVAEVRALAQANPLASLPARAFLPPDHARRLSKRRGGLARFLQA